MLSPTLYFNVITETMETAAVILHTSFTLPLQLFQTIDTVKLLSASSLVIRDFKARKVCITTTNDMPLYKLHCNLWFSTDFPLKFREV